MSEYLLLEERSRGEGRNQWEKQQRFQVVIERSQSGRPTHSAGQPKWGYFWSPDLVGARQGEMSESNGLIVHRENTKFNPLRITTLDSEVWTGQLLETVLSPFGLSRVIY